MKSAWSSRPISAVSSKVAGSTLSTTPLASSTICGRMPSTTRSHPRALLASSKLAGVATRNVGSAATWKPSAESARSRKFMPGEPMKNAAKRSTGSSKRAVGGPACTIRPARMRTTRSASDMASRWSCVTCTVVTPSSFWRWRSSQRISSRYCSSTAERGSSRRSTSGSRTTARASAAFCRAPGGRPPGKRSRMSSIEKIFETHATFFAISRFDIPRARRGKATFWRTVRCG